MEKPDVDYIDGLSPAISIEQKTTHRNPRSTVGTVTEIYDYFRLLYARIGVPYCHECGKRIIVAVARPDRRIAPDLRRGRSSRSWRPWCAEEKASTPIDSDSEEKGFVRVRVDGEMMNLEDEIASIRTKSTPSKSSSTGS